MCETSSSNAWCASHYRSDRTRSRNCDARRTLVVPVDGWPCERLSPRAKEGMRWTSKADAIAARCATRRRAMRSSRVSVTVASASTSRADTPTSSWACPSRASRTPRASPKAFRRSDLENPVTREFCADCGTHILTKTPKMPGAVLIKVGTLDDPERLRWTADGDLHHRQAELPSPARGRARVRARAGLTARDERSRRWACRLARSRADHLREAVRQTRHERFRVGHRGGVGRDAEVARGRGS